MIDLNEPIILTTPWHDELALDYCCELRREGDHSRWWICWDYYYEGELVACGILRPSWIVPDPELTYWQRFKVKIGW